MAKTLQAGMPAVDYDAVLLKAFEKHIGPAQFAHIKRGTSLRHNAIGSQQTAATRLAS